MKPLFKSLAIILVLISLLGRAPQPVRASGLPVVDILNNAVNWLQTASDNITAAVETWTKSGSILNQALKRVAAKVLLKTTNKIINWGATGFNGNPFYLQDQGSFFQSIADQQLANKIDDTLYQKCNGGACPYARITAKALIRGYANSKQGSKYDLNQILGTNEAEKCREGDPTNYWACNSALIQNPQNNALGAYIETSRELSDRIQTEQKFTTQELTQNNGFLSLKRCVQKKPKNAQGQVLNVSTATAIYPHTTLDGKSVSCVKDPKLQQSAWSCNGQSICSSVSVEINRKLWEGENCYDKNSTGVNGVNVGLGIGDIAINQSQLGSGNFSADDCARYEVTTPGKLIEEQVNKALITPIDDKLNAKSNGGALIDMLVDLTANLVDRGLSSLVSKSSNRPQLVNGGNTVITGNADSSWYTGDIDSGLELEDSTQPGQASKTLQDAISYTEAEINILNQIRILNLNLPEKTMQLDQCLPGPDLGWEIRLQDEYQKAIRKLTKKEDKDNKHGEQATDAINRLDTVLAKSKQEISLGLVGFGTGKVNIPSAAVILGKIKDVRNLTGNMTMYSDQLNQKVGALGILKDIKRQIELHPSQIVNGQLVVNPSQNLSDLRSRFSQIKVSIGNEESIKEAQSSLDILQQTDKNTFDKTNPDSMISQCMAERRANPEIVGRDQGETLFCLWQLPVASGTTIPGELNDPVTTKYVPFGYTQDLSPYDETFGGTPGLNLDCNNFYRSSLIDYLPQ